MLWFILSSTEPLHDVKEHISNIITEIVAHLTSEEKKLCFSSRLPSNQNVPKLQLGK